MVLQPGNGWVIEKAMPVTEANEENIQTCLMRGWVEVLYESVPMQKLPSDGDLKNASAVSAQHIYRLTEGGWNAIHRTRSLNLLSFIVALIGISIAVFSL
ncbi:hypothetical protein [Syntrophotalea acetylenica]|uniref:hypothetical protein n=1 Tax=Syntrophotalea acetylenica TaxID=29542 RepID=UPI002A36B13B|nr:hypothetical protein [Syntrophotalea acetylenica]MDY0263517.1 hypothetical protein [Syntrophotalea acetylenica]